EEDEVREEGPRQADALGRRPGADELDAAAAEHQLDELPARGAVLDVEDARRPAAAPRPRRELGVRGGELDAEAGARPGLALDRDPSAHRLDDPARERQAEPEPARLGLPPEPVVGHEEPLEVL